MKGASPKILLVDDDVSFRRALSTVLARSGYDVQTFESGLSFLQSADRSISGCVILDLNMPGTDGLTIQKKMRADGWETPVIFLTGYGTVDSAVCAMRDGATTFLSKPVDPDQMLEAVREAIEADAAHQAARDQRSDVEARLTKLTPRENEVVDLIVQGKRTKQIAAELFISIKTVETHRDNIMKKLDAANVAEVVRIVTTRNMLAKHKVMNG